jgi:predicted NUDIX family NTP pyrophosphohydrolase
MQRKSAGILLYRLRDGALEVFLVHPGGPFWVRKDIGAWSIPKGEFNDNEEPLAAAQREFEEETGFRVSGTFIALSPVKLKGGKIVMAWALEGDCDPSRVSSNTFLMEWPPRSGKRQEFPEVDRAEWFDVDEARKKINSGQKTLVEELSKIVAHERD